MRMKLIVAFVAEEKTDRVIAAARAGGATGATVLTGVRGEGLRPGKTFLGLDLKARLDVVLLLVVEDQARAILESVGEAGAMDSEGGAGVAFQLPVEDAVGLATQLPVVREAVRAAL